MICSVHKAEEILLSYSTPIIMCRVFTSRHALLQPGADSLVYLAISLRLILLCSCLSIRFVSGHARAVSPTLSGSWRYCRKQQTCRAISLVLYSHHRSLCNVPSLLFPANVHSTECHHNPPRNTRRTQRWLYTGSF